MRRAYRPALLLVTLSLAVPGTCAPALAADPATALTRAEMAVALTQVAADSAAAADHGWRGTYAFTAGPSGFTEEILVDTGTGTVVDRSTNGTTTAVTYARAGTGLYEGLFDRRSRAIVRMTGRTGTGYLFTPGRTLTVASFLEETPVPAPGRAGANAHEAGTRITRPDGTTDYRVAVAEHSMTFTFHVSAAGVLTGIDGVSPEVSTSTTYTYGRQSVTPPPAAQAITRAEYWLGNAYLKMSRTAEHAKVVADTGAAATREAAKGRAIKVPRLRTQLRTTARRYNAGIGMTIVKIKDIRGGVRVYVTNPWTHETRCYPVKAAGRKVVVTSGW
ncbi:hypothetical protein [Actinoplanes sp. NPDC051494]|uniref:hypothetical protein n=1 Tax=Actinoplanes sp. NPDC051494 TaxID=3363907 RepID=UPI00378E7D38